MRTLVAWFLFATAAYAAPRDPFLAPPAAGPKLLHLLAPTDFIDRTVVETYERDSGMPVALDFYAGPLDLSEHLSERRYDLVVFNGPELTRRLDRLTRLDRSRLPNARFVQPLVAGKYATYDRDGAFGVPFGWSAFGLLYDSDRLHEPPVSWAQALGGAKDTQRFGACGIVWPDSRESSFVAAFKLMGVDPGRATPTDVKAAAALLDRARGSFVAFAAPDEVGALAKGVACLGAGVAGEAAAVAARGGDNAPTIRYAYPREGALLTLYAFAIPKNATSPNGAYLLLDTLLAPENARRDAALAGASGAEDETDLAELKRLTPEPLLSQPLVAAMQAEWKRLTSAK